MRVIIYVKGMHFTTAYKAESTAAALAAFVADPTIATTFGPQPYQGPPIYPADVSAAAWREGAAFRFRAPCNAVHVPPELMRFIVYKCMSCGCEYKRLMQPCGYGRGLPLSMRAGRELISHGYCADCAPAVISALDMEIAAKRAEERAPAISRALRCWALMAMTAACSIPGTAKAGIGCRTITLSAVLWPAKTRNNGAGKEDKNI